MDAELGPGNRISDDGVVRQLKPRQYSPSGGGIHHPSQLSFRPREATTTDHNNSPCTACNHDYYHDPTDGCSYHYFTPGTNDNYTRCHCTRQHP